MQLSSYALGLSQAAAANDDGQLRRRSRDRSGGSSPRAATPNVSRRRCSSAGSRATTTCSSPKGDYTGLYTGYLANPPSAYPPFVEWCHPSVGDFNSFAVTNDGKAVVSLMALITGPGVSTSITESDVGSTTGNESLFQDALRKGFRVSPAGDQDNHNATWGAATQTRTVALAPGKTKSEILNALAQGRNYASQDHNTQVQFSADGHPMGAAWTSPDGPSFAVKVIDPDPGDGVAQIDLFRGITGVSNAVVVASSDGNSSFAWRDRSALAEGTEAHYYLRIRMNSNANIWTGPVYVTRGSLIAVGDPPPASAIALGREPESHPGPHDRVRSPCLRRSRATARGLRRRRPPGEDAARRTGSRPAPTRSRGRGQSDDGSIAALGRVLQSALTGQASMRSTRKILLIR
jgi:hypothetical protein